MKERPIIFNTEMVKAILSGRKTVTRRPVKPIHKEACGFYVNFDHKGEKVMSVTDYDEDEAMYDNDTRCPFGQIGDRLYVRETAIYWRTKNGIDKVAAFKADDYELEDNEQWVPSIHMPKKSSRIWLEITDVRVERVQSITDEQAPKEGLYKAGSQCIDQTCSEECVGCGAFMPRLMFSELWDSIYKNWSDNPWVWVVEFKVIDK